MAVRPYIKWDDFRKDVAKQIKDRFANHYKFCLLMDVESSMLWRFMHGASITADNFMMFCDVLDLKPMDYV